MTMTHKGTVKNNTGFNNRPIVLLQTTLWFLFGGWFLIAAFLLAIDSPYAETISYIGLILVLSSVPARIFVMAEQFRKARLFRFALLSYLLLVILCATALFRYLVKS